MNDVEMRLLGLEGYGFDETFILSMLLLSSQAMLLAQQMYQYRGYLERPVWIYDTLQQCQDGIQKVIDASQPDVFSNGKG